MKHPLLLAASLCAPALAQAQSASVTPLVTERLAGIPGKEGTMLLVEYAPGASDPVHRHNAHVFVYMLEGAVVMQVEGGKEARLAPGQTFYEAPGDVHVVGRNASTTAPAKFLAFFVKDAGAPSCSRFGRRRPAPPAAPGRTAGSGPAERSSGDRADAGRRRPAV